MSDSDTAENQAKPVNLDRTLARVRALIAKAEAEIAPGATDTEREYALKEQQAAREMADALMLRYAIERATVNASLPAAERVKPMKISVEIGAHDSDILGYIAQLATDIAAHCRCKIRAYGQYDYQAKAWVAKVYGFESDVKYFEYLYTTLRLHMLGVLIPKFDPTLSMEENCYRLHEAGYNWLEMAAMQGWRKFPNQEGVPGHLIRYYNQQLDEEKPAGQVGGMYKRPYYAACKIKGETPKKIAAGATEGFRRGAALGYTDQLRRRLRQVRVAREGQSTNGQALMLRSSFEDVEAMYREDNPELFVKVVVETDGKPARKVRMKAYKAPSINFQGYGAGVSHANKADLNAGMNGGSRREIQ